LLGVLHEGEKLGFRGTIVEPTSWSTTGAPPATQVHPRSYINHILIPEAEPLPPLITFHVDVFLERVIPLSASSLSGLVGKTDHGPFGDVTVSDVASKGGDVVVSLTLDGSPPSPSVYAALGPRSATLTQGADHVVGTIAPQEPPVSSVQIQFRKPSGSGPVTLGLSDWTLSAGPQLGYEGAPGACGNV
jgi:hypothetical protein